MVKITSVKARQIFGSRGNPTVEVDVSIDDGIYARAAVPSGASTAGAAAATAVAGQAAADVVTLTAATRFSGKPRDELAAIKIQTVFRGYKAWNLQASIDLTLGGPKGQVYALIVGNDTLFAGTQDGTIWAWKPNLDKCRFEPAATLCGHKKAQVSFIAGAHRLYSGSMDYTIRLWDLATLQCTHTLTGHESVVMSLLCWDQYLLSCSLDGTVKVWAATETMG